MKAHHDTRPQTVPAPHAWDGVGQALRAAYRDHRDPPCDLSAVLHRLNTID